MAPAEKIFYFILFSCVWGWRCAIVRSSRVPCCSARLATGPPLANVVENGEGFYGCLPPQLSFLLSSLKNDFRHFIYIFNHG